MIEPWQECYLWLLTAFTSGYLLANSFVNRMFANFDWPYRVIDREESIGLFKSSNANPPLGVNRSPTELTFIIRTSELGSAAVRNNVGINNFVRSACPTWFVPNWISYPSCVRSAGTPMIPALLSNMSRREEEALKLSAAFLTEGREVRSRGRYVIEADGHDFLISSMVDVAVDGVRAAR